VRLPVVFLLLTVMLDSMGIGLIVPVLPDLMMEVSGEHLSGAARWGGLLSSIYAVAQFVIAPLLGNLSDAYGRRVVLLSTLGIVIVDYAVMAFASSLWLLFVARAIGGAASATQATAAAAMADLSEPGKRAQGFGLIGAAFGMGFVFGPVLGGILGEFGSRAPFWAAAVLAFGNLLLGLFFFPETVTDENRRRFTLQGINPFAAFRNIGQLPHLRTALVILLLYNVAFGVYPAVWSYFGTARFEWTPGMIGLSLGLFGVSMAVVQGGLMRWILKALGESGTVTVGLGCAALAYFLIPLAPYGWLVLALTPIAAVGSAFGPALQAIMSQSLGPDEQGALQGVLTSTAAVAMVVTPTLMTGVFAAFTRADSALQFPGAPFILSFGLTSLAFLLFVTQRKAPLTH